MWRWSHGCDTLMSQESLKNRAVVEMGVKAAWTYIKLQTEPIYHNWATKDARLATFAFNLPAKVPYKRIIRYCHKGGYGIQPVTSAQQNVDTQISLIVLPKEKNA